MARTMPFKATLCAAAALFISLTVGGCGGPRIEPNAMLESYDTVVLERNTAPYRDRIDQELQRMALLPITEGDVRLDDATTASRAMIATIRTRVGFLSAGGWLELRDYKTNELLLSAHARARFWIYGRARAAQGAVRQIRQFYRGFSPHLYEVRMERRKTAP